MKGFMEGERDNGSLTCLWSKNLPTYEDHRDLHGSCTTSQAILEIVIARHSPPGVHFRPRLPSLSVILTMNRGGARRSTHKKLLKKMSKGQPMHRKYYHGSQSWSMDQTPRQPLTEASTLLT